jgi:MGT family glycosyltransferase
VATIGVVHVGWHGHVGPANRLGAVLAAAGHRVIAWAPPAFHAQLAAAGAEPRSLGSPGPTDADAGPVKPPPSFERRRPEPGAGPALAVMHGIHQLSVGLAVTALVVTDELIGELHAAGVELVVHDAMAPWGRVAAEWLGLPRLVSYPGFPPPYDLDAPPIDPATDDRLASVRQAIAERWGVELSGSRDVLLSTGDLNTAYTTPRIAGQGAEDGSWRLVGPLMHAPPATAGDRRAPAGDGPLVYMALGTVHNWRADVFRAGIEAMAGSGARLLVATGGRLPPAVFEPHAQNIAVVDRVDSRAVLAAAAVHITHGGANSVHEALAAGVPMVCLPQGDDHYLWADRVRALGAGVVLDEADPAAIREAVAAMLGDASPRRAARDLAEHLKDFPGEAEVARALDELLG